MENVKEPKIKIYVSCHKESYIPDNKLFYPVQVGAKTAKKRFKNMQHDDDGENISAENRCYCELTTQYWAWKNEKADYYGFFHYRRYLSFNPVKLEEDMFGNVDLERPDEVNLKQLWIEESKIINIVKKYDIVTSQATDLTNLGGTVYGHYKFHSPYHKIEDLDLAIEIINKIYPEYAEATSKYINSSKAYFCNLYIMKKEVFDDYCEWIFKILDEHKKRSNFDEYSIDEARVYGFLSERLFGIYYTYWKEKAEFQVKELQRTLFRDTELIKEIEPAFSKNNIPIVLSGDRNYLPYIATLIASIMSSASNNINYDLTILHSDIEDKEQERLKREFENYRNLSIRFYDMKKDTRDYNFKVNSHFGVENYYRIYIPRIFRNYEKVLYLDSDLIVLEDIAKLYAEDIGDCLVGAVKDIDWLAGYCKTDIARKEYEKRYLKLTTAYNYFNSGVLIWNVKQWNQQIKLDDIIELATSESWMFVDQDVLNKVCNGKVYFLSQKWNVLVDYNMNGYSRLSAARYIPKTMYEEYLSAREKANIIHYAGGQKPWRYVECDFAEIFWKYARKTGYYEKILQGVQNSINNENGLAQGTVANESSIVKQVDNQGIKIKGIDEPVYVDGIMIKAINIFNKKYPIGSKKRDRLRKIVKKFVK